jgi:hypothetical protein
MADKKLIQASLIIGIIAFLMGGGGAYFYLKSGHNKGMIAFSGTVKELGNPKDEIIVGAYDAHNINMTPIKTSTSGSVNNTTGAYSLTIDNAQDFGTVLVCAPDHNAGFTDGTAYLYLGGCFTNSTKTDLPGDFIESASPPNTHTLKITIIDPNKGTYNVSLTDVTANAVVTSTALVGDNVTFGALVFTAQAMTHSNFTLTLENQKTLDKVSYNFFLVPIMGSPSTIFATHIPGVQ